MKKIYIIGVTIVLVIVSTFLFFKWKGNSLEKTLEKAQAYSKYELICDMEMVQNDELKSYEVKVDFLKNKKQKYYKVELYDKSLNQSQIIIKNKEGVYVLTPTLNQVFKFQSEWPDNSPKPYIYSSLISLLKDNKVEKIKNGYQVEGKIKYPNDARIVKEEIIFDKNLNPQRITCLDKDETEIIIVKVKEFNTKKNIKTQHFNQDKVLEESKSDYKTASADILYPVAIMGSTLESETVSTIEGDKNHILRFTGEKNFTIVESQEKKDEAVVNMMNDEVIDLIDGFAYYSDGKLSMINSGVMCSLYSNDLTKDEMVSIMTSMQSSTTK